MTENPQNFTPPEAGRTEVLQAMTDGLAHAESMLQISRTALVDALIHDENESRQTLDQPQYENIVAVLSRNGIIVCESAIAYKTLGFQPGELMGKRFFDFVHANELSAAYGAFLNVIEGLAKDTAARFRHRMGDGGYRWLNCMAMRINETTEPLAVFRMIPERVARTMLRL